MRISDLGEFGLIERFSKPFLDGISSGIIGIGDDCAVIPKGNDEALLVTTDLLLEDIHFLTKAISPEDLGYKCLAVSLSDIAAMGGLPQFAFLSLALPPNTDVAWVDSFFEGLHSLAQDHHISLLGGDTTSSKGAICINVGLLGSAPLSQIKLRSAAKPGDLVCVTGPLGDSAAGLKTILENPSLDEDLAQLIHRHHRPTPRVAQGQWLSKFAEVHAMMDISDGVASDIQRILKSSNCGATLDIEKIPLSHSLHKSCLRLGWSASEFSFTGGEDYELLFTIDPQAFEKVNNLYIAQFSQPFYSIGRITNEKQVLKSFLNGDPIQLSEKGFDHFLGEL